MATLTAFPLPHTAQQSAEAAQALHDDIRTRWSRLTDREIGHLSSTDELITKVAGLYGLSPDTAKSDVAGVLKGRLL